MERFIHRLKQRPEHHRRHITFAVSSGVTALIFILWVTVVVPQTIKSETLVVVPEKSSPVSSANTPLGTIRTSAAATWEGLRNIFSNGSDAMETVNVENEYQKLKSQVQNGDIQLVPNRQQ